MTVGRRCHARGFLQTRVQNALDFPSGTDRNPTYRDKPDDARRSDQNRKTVEGKLRGRPARLAPADRAHAGRQFIQIEGFPR
jgi:hypothetical protein